MMIFAKKCLSPVFTKNDQMILSFFLILAAFSIFSHISLEIYEFCKENHKEILTISAYVLTFFECLIKALFVVYDSHIISIELEKIRAYDDIAGLFHHAYINVTYMGNNFWICS